MYYYEIHVELGKEGYSVGVKCEEPLNDEEIVELALQQQKFEENGDHYCVDGIESMTEKEYKNCFEH